MKEVNVIEHPLVQHKLTLIRDKRTGSKELRELVRELAILMAYEVTRHLPLCEMEVETPMAPVKARVVGGSKIGIIPILRAGLAMADGMMDLIPTACIGHIGLYRDPDTLEPVRYYCKLPGDLAFREIIIVDPMLATGGSVVEAINILKEEGAVNIRLLVLLAAPEGIKKVHDEHPDIPIYTAAVDERIDHNGYIIPGLGDAGDRLYGTK